MPYGHAARTEFGVGGGFLVASFALVNVLVLLSDGDSWSYE